MEEIARALAEAREHMYVALVAAQRDDWATTVDAIERAEQRLREAVDAIDARAAA